jgi:3-methyladenine DNA glycosylase/8-oxoguanine DNA glycosylase
MPFTIAKPTGFRLAAAIAFYAGFTPGSGMAAASTSCDVLTLAFLLDGTFAPVAASLRETGDSLVVEYAGDADEDVLRAQLTRMLGLDVDGDAWRAVGVRDPVIGGLQRAFPGFFTAAKASPYDAATWAVIAPRMPMQRAANVKIAIAREHGHTVRLNGRDHRLFPNPTRLAELESFGGLTDEKVARLRGIAEAAPRLDANRLLALGDTRALAELQELRGVGPWAASHIFYRGAAPHDALPTAEPRVLHGVGFAYNIATPTEAEYAAIAKPWAPFRMWVTILLMRNLARSDRWNAPELGKQRAAAGRSLRRA